VDRGSHSDGIQYIFIFYFDRFEPARVRDAYKIINNIILYYISPRHCRLNIFPFDAIAYSLRRLFFTTVPRSPVLTRSNVFWLRWAPKTFCFVMHLNTFIFPSYIFHLSAFFYSYNISVYIYIDHRGSPVISVLMCLCTVHKQSFYKAARPPLFLYFFFYIFFFWSTW